MGALCSSLYNCQLVKKDNSRGVILTWVFLIVNIFLTPFFLCAWCIRIYVIPCLSQTFLKLFYAILTACCGNFSCFLYTDTSFPCNDQNAGKHGAKWVRLQDVKIAETNTKGGKNSNNGSGKGDVKKINRLFSGIQPDDIAQGALGDCWLLAAIATLAERPHLLQNCFLTNGYNPRGKYTIRLYDDHSKCFKNITIDDFIPVDDNNVPIYTGAKGNEMWPLLLEKAFAKMRGGYEKLDGGLPLDAMSTITGFAGDRFDLTHDDKVFRKCKRLFDGGCIMACGSKGVDKTREEGRDKVKGSVVGGHAYSILGVYEPMLSTEKVRLLKLRNPWGSFEWQGRWSDKSDDWKKYPGVALEIGRPKDIDDGIFYIEWNDFVAHYDFVDVLYPATTIADLHINIHEEMGICGPTLGCLLGVGRFWCLCRGLYSLWFVRDSEHCKKDLEYRNEV